MEFKRLKNTFDQYFNEAWSIYEDAFPLEERRILKEQLRILEHSNYHCDIVLENEQCIGILFWWNFESLRFIDHFATASHLRNKGFGQTILNSFISLNDKPILLEVELPTTNLNVRRIKFYERGGFILNEHHYEIPNGKVNEPPFQLLLMSYPNHITKKDVIKFVEICHPIFFD